MPRRTGGRPRKPVQQEVIRDVRGPSPSPFGVPLPEIRKAPTPKVIIKPQETRPVYVDPWEAYREYLRAGRQIPAISRVTAPYREQLSSQGWRFDMPTYTGGGPIIPGLSASTGWQYARPYSAAPVYFSPAEQRASMGWRHGKTPAQIYEEMRGMSGLEPSGVTSGTGGVHPRSLKELYSRWRQSPKSLYDYMIEEEEPVYGPEQYYAGGDGGGITIRYGGGGGSPSSRRDYASTLINWRV
jgi:hypothetical protein